VDKTKIGYDLVGKKLIKTAINIDESLVEILKVEVKRIKKLAKNCDTIEELQKTNNLIKNIIMAFTITDDKIRMGIDLCLKGNDSGNASDSMRL
jgi:hypothetical protein